MLLGNIRCTASKDGTIRTSSRNSLTRTWTHNTKPAQRSPRHHYSTMQVPKKLQQTISSSSPEHQQTAIMDARYNKWQGGDIASLMPPRLFSQDHYNALLKPSAGNTRSYLDIEACGHPVLVLLRLSKLSTHALITPISSHGSRANSVSVSTGARKLPWDRKSNRHKKPEHYRALCHSPRPNERYDSLQLEDGATLPMSHASWIDIQKVWVVPLSLLRPFSIDGGPQWLPRLRRDSLIDLRGHMSEECGWWKEHMRRLRAVEPRAGPAAPSITSLMHTKTEGGVCGRSWAAVVIAAPPEPSMADGLEDLRSVTSEDHDHTVSTPSVALSSISTVDIQGSSGDDDDIQGEPDDSSDQSATDLTCPSIFSTSRAGDYIASASPWASCFVAPTLEDNRNSNSTSSYASVPVATNPEDKSNSESTSSCASVSVATNPEDNDTPESTLSWASVLVAPAPVSTQDKSLRWKLFKKPRATAAPLGYNETGSFASPAPSQTKDQEEVAWTMIEDEDAEEEVLNSTSIVASTEPGTAFHVRPAVPEFKEESESTSIVAKTASSTTFHLRPTAPEFIPMNG